MFYIVETNSQFDDFKEISVENHFIYPIYEDDRVHPMLGNVVAVYVYSYYLSKSFIIAIDHPDCMKIESNLVIQWIASQDVVYTINGKLLLHWAGDNVPKDIIDLKIGDKVVDENTDPQRKWFYSMYRSSKQVNKIIPITIHKRYYDTFIPRLIESRTMDFPDMGYQSDMLRVFYKIEQNGLHINKKTFKEKFPDADLSYNTLDSRIFTWYNVYNKTSRPTNNFNSINFTALSKDSGVRNDIIAEPDSILLELDFKAYHPYLLADKLGIVFDENIYIHLAKQYFNTDNPTEEQYEQSKKKTFKYIYTFDPAYDHIEFIRKCKDLKHQLFEEQEGFLTETQVMPHLLQRLETERNVNILVKVFECIKDTDIKMILYTYDSLLFNIPKSCAGIIGDLIAVVDDPKFPIKITYGKDYGSMKEM